ncbi:phage tail spike protein [Globicatella sp. PHS-GS-PNBC-21-1553]|uniref:phage tail spike protein n=1 Tax=Globicatella sp. PHS-GS-PNBC-21-1553 TaxID=2885764 RepID=UPI00298EFD10|nr:phage tail spike protein [Globicatella sp. PHS-GS-PNBC-21-1553]WPC08602.1 NlpC/P60 family protein [Globicatella sp. PHS-GS-PNBC-21-1553]
MKQIELLDKDFKRLAFIDNNTENGLHFVDDKLSTSIEGGIYVADINFDKSSPQHINLKEGNYITFLNRQGVRILGTIMQVDETSRYKKVYIEDASLNLINKVVGGVELPSTPKDIKWYFDKMLLDTGWSIGKNESTKQVAMEFSNSETLLSRIKKVCKEFEVEFYFETILDTPGVPDFKIHLVKQRVEGDAGFRLSSDDFLEGISRKTNIDNIVTKLIVESNAQPKDASPTPPTSNPVKPTPSSIHQEMLEKMIKWFKDREGKVKYSMTAARVGPNYYDCSSAVYSALFYAGFKPNINYIGSTVSLWTDIGPDKLMVEIPRAQAQRGDLFLSGPKGAASGGENGHTGVFVSNTHIIHCNYKDNGITTTPVAGRSGEPLYVFRLVNKASQPTPTVSSKTEKAVQRALSYVGKTPYIWGGTTTRGWDCSGMIYEVYRHAGFNINHRCTTATIQAQQSPFRKISASEARRGDLIVNNNGGHVAILLGTISSGAGIVHAASEQLGTITQKSLMNGIVGYYRVMG